MMEKEGNPVPMLFLVDFDGTITEVDTVEAMVKKFARGDWQSLNKLWEEKVIDTQEVARRVFAMFDADAQDIFEFTETMKVDLFFADFAAAVDHYSDRLFIVSDGYDLLIETILKREGLEHIPFYANRMIIDGRNFTMKPGGLRSTCKKCGTCKRDVLAHLKEANDTVVYVGDSYSDLCVVEVADVVFAKSILLQHCIENNIPCLPYDSFADILAWYHKQMKR